MPDSSGRAFRARPRRPAHRRTGEAGRTAPCAPLCLHTAFPRWGSWGRCSEGSSCSSLSRECLTPWEKEIGHRPTGPGVPGTPPQASPQAHRRGVQSARSHRFYNISCRVLLCVARMKQALSEAKKSTTPELSTQARFGGSCWILPSSLQMTMISGVNPTPEIIGTAIELLWDFLEGKCGDREFTRFQKSFADKGSVGST